MRYETTVTIDAAPDRVWGVLSDVSRWPEWTASMSTVEPLGSLPLALGTRVRIKQPRLPAAVWEVTELEPGRSFTWTNSSPGLTSTGVHRVEPAADGRARVVLAISQEGPMSLVARAFRSRTERYVEMEAAGLKSRSEER